MLSKGGKVEWKCPYCRGDNIGHRRGIGETFSALLNPLLTRFNSGWCYDCKDLFCWAARIKISLKRGKKDGNR